MEHARKYENILQEQGYVIPDFTKRRNKIRDCIAELSIPDNGEVIIEDDLLDEVTSLTEWPVALVGKFDEKFLRVPAKALISTMKSNQKYFHIRNEQQETFTIFCNNRKY